MTATFGNSQICLFLCQRKLKLSFPGTKNGVFKGATLLRQHQFLRVTARKGFKTAFFQSCRLKHKMQHVCCLFHSRFCISFVKDVSPDGRVVESKSAHWTEPKWGRQMGCAHASWMPSKEYMHAWLLFVVNGLLSSQEL